MTKFLVWENINYNKKVFAVRSFDSLSTAGESKRFRDMLHYVTLLREEAAKRQNKDVRSISTQPRVYLLDLSKAHAV